MTKWISVTEQLPESDAEVWIWDGDTAWLSFYSAHNRCFYYIMDYGYWDSEPLDDVTHWMPVIDPEPPA